jgi:branched-subunit amino acid aminotransferase/4-amino-4-deoxychorismate lyase
MVKALVNSAWKEVPEESLLIGGPDFAYPSGLYETLRTVDYIPAFLGAHLKRLFQAARRIGVKLEYTQSEITRQVIRVIHSFPDPNQRVRIIAVPDQIIIYTSALNLDTTIYRGVNVISLPVRRPTPELKTTQTESSLQAWLKAQQQGCFEALLISEEGIVFEGSRSNVFWVRQGNLFTKKAGVLPGTTRELVLTKASQPVLFSDLNVRDLDRIGEMFLTNSGSGVVPVKTIDGHELPKPVPGKITAVIMARYNTWLAEDIARFRKTTAVD